MLKMVILKVKQSLVLISASVRFSRERLNKFYNTLPYSKKAEFHAKYAKTFRRFNIKAQPGVWYLDFLGKEIRIPLTSDRMWLDWDLAVSTVAHDVEVKRFYQDLLLSNRRPAVFFDVGANYGTHSLLMASQDVKTYAFEPNSRCVSIGREILASNDFDVTWFRVAIGAERTQIDLSYPERDTWLGRVNRDIIDPTDRQSKAERVDLVPLDDFRDRARGGQLLIKIDTEGFEIDVLTGVRNLIESLRPIIVFESNEEHQRLFVFQTLQNAKYEIFLLPFEKRCPHTVLSLALFLKNRGTNFVAIPKDLEIRLASGDG